MTLDDWIALPRDTRRDRLKHWKNITPAGEKQEQAETAWTELAQEAAERFRPKYETLEGVLCVGPSQLFDAESTICIWVTTRLLKGQTLTGLPVEYATFPVVQEPVGEEIQAFKDTWSAVLSRLFDWDPISIAEFISDREDFWRDTWFLHDPPCRTLPGQVLARSVIQSSHGYDEFKLVQIGEELIRAIGGNWYLHQEAEYDWQAAEQRIARIIEKYDRP